MAQEELINPRSGRRVTRIVKARHRELERDVVLQRTGEVVRIKSHAYDPNVHAALDSIVEADVTDEAPSRPKRKAKKKKK